MVVAGYDMTGLAADFIVMLFMDRACFCGRIHLMAVGACRFPLQILLAVRLCTVSVQFLCLVAAQAIHLAFREMDIRHTAGFSGELRVNSSAVTCRAGLVFIFFPESVVGEKALIDACHHGRLHVTVPAGGMARSAGLLEYFRIEQFTLRFGKAFMDTVAKTGGCIVQGFFIVIAYFFVAGCAVFNLVGWPCD